MLRRERKQRQMTRPLDRKGELTLVPGTRAGSPTGHDLASVGEIVPQLIRGFVVNGQCFVGAESTPLATSSSKGSPALPSLLTLTGRPRS